jgi:hypothetical protein
MSEQESSLLKALSASEKEEDEVRVNEQKHFQTSLSKGGSPVAHHTSAKYYFQKSCKST